MKFPLCRKSLSFRRTMEANFCLFKRFCYSVFSTERNYDLCGLPVTSCHRPSAEASVPTKHSTLKLDECLLSQEISIFGVVNLLPIRKSSRRIINESSSRPWIVPHTKFSFHSTRTWSKIVTSRAVKLVLAQSTTKGLGFSAATAVQSCARRRRDWTEIEIALLTFWILN